jgi:hypothetical protein
MKEGSLAKKVIDVWMYNRRNRGQSWSGPLPPPRQSPLRTLGDALANAKFERQTKCMNLSSGKDRRFGYSAPQSSSVSQRQSPMPTVNEDRAMSNLDPWIESTQSVQEGGRKTESSTLALSNERRSSSPGEND